MGQLLLTLRLRDEKRITLKQAAALYPGHRGAERLHPATLTRWILRGVTGLDGRRIKLEGERIGCRWLTSEAALARFAEALGTAEESADALPSTCGRESEIAARELEKLGA
jgi:hypothetical protein